MKQSILLIFSFLVCTAVFSQNLNTFFFNNLSQFNPAFTGFESKRFVYLESKIPQYKGIDFQVGTGFSIKRFGFGVNHFQQFNSNKYQSSISELNLSYALIENETHKLSIGTGLGFNQTTFRLSDSIINAYHQTSLHLGVAYRFKDFTVGLNASIGIESSLSKYSSANLILGYNWQVNDRLIFKPTFLFIASEHGFHSYGFSLNADIGKHFYLGASSISSRSVGFNAGLQWKDKFRLGAGIETQSYISGNRLSGRVSFTYLIK